GRRDRFPRLDDAMGPDTGPPPQLLPIDSLISEAQATDPDPGPALASRATALKARAAAINAAPPPT
ncbi:MAG: hypothetical protein ACKO2N_21905, partial [Tabrizicola sp.]